MNWAGDMFGVLYGRRFDLEMAWAIRKMGDRVGAGKNIETSCEGLYINYQLGELIIIYS